jgi:hypothetical protein
MIKIEFSEEDKKKIDYERYNHPHPRVQRKMEALWLKSQDIAHNEICRLTGISKDTLIRYLKAYRKGGIVNYPAHRAGLQKGIIIFILRESVPQTP